MLFCNRAELSGRTKHRFGFASPTDPPCHRGYPATLGKDKGRTWRQPQWSPFLRWLDVRFTKQKKDPKAEWAFGPHSSQPPVGLSQTKGLFLWNSTCKFYTVQGWHYNLSFLSLEVNSLLLLTIYINRDEGGQLIDNMAQSKGEWVCASTQNGENEYFWAVSLKHQRSFLRLFSKC